MERVELIRQSCKQKNLHLTYTTFVAKAIGCAVREHMTEVPELNAFLVRWPFWRIVYCSSIDLAIAVELKDRDRTFHTHIFREIDRLSLAQMAKELDLLASRSSINPIDIKTLWTMKQPVWFQRIILGILLNHPGVRIRDYGTQFLTQVGKYGVSLVPGGTGHLEFSMGPVEPQAVVHKRQVVARLQMELTVSFDHRLFVAGPIARLLARIRNLLEIIPDSWLDESFQGPEPFEARTDRSV